MTLTDLISKNKEPPKWIEEDQIVSTQGCIGEDIIIELKLVSSENYNDLQFDLIRDGLPISSDRYRLSMRGNVVQLALKQSRKNDAGYYSLVAKRLGQENDKGTVKKIHLSINEINYEESDPPIFLRRLSDLAVKVGTRTRFLIEIQSSSTTKISWYKDDSPIYEGPRFSLVHEGNFHCVDVAPVTVEDQGCWTCMAENRSGRSSCTSTLTVIVPKAYKKPEFVEELRALLTETGTVSLECKVVGVPTPVLRWFKDSKEIKAGDVFALTANPDDPTSLGVYTCEANNCMGTTYSSSKVHVVGRGSREGSLKPADTLAPSGPLPIFKQILQDECCRIGDTLILSCRVQVPPWPKVIAWYNKGGRVEPDERYHIMEDGIGGYSIKVKQVEARDEGEWKCVATSEENIKQFTSCYVAMSIPRNYRKPRFMENLKAVLTEEGLVSFECKVVGFPTPLLRWFKDGQELKPGDVYQLTGTNSLGSYCCIARNCMGEAKSTAELTIEDIQNQLNEEERFQLLSTNQPPKFIKGLRSCEARINEHFRFTVQVSVAPEPNLSWYRDDALVEESDKYHAAKENLGTCHFEVRKLEFIDQAEWKCVAANDFGHSVTSCFLKLIIPKHYKKPKFLESLRAILSEEGAVNLECKVIGVPQPVLKWYKDNVELKPGDIHRITSGQDGTCCLGTYTCEAINCMGTVSSSASLLGFEDKKETKEIQSPNNHELARNLSLSTIHEERTSQLYDTPQTDHSVTLDERGEVSFSFDGKEVSVSLYETPDLTEEEALQIVEMYADQLSEHVTEHNVIELPPMRFVKETSTSGNLLMEAVVIDVSPDYFVSAEEGDDLRTEADFEDVSIMDDVTHVLSSPEQDSRGSLKRSAEYNVDENEKVPVKPPRKKSSSISLSKSEKSQRIESESFHSAQKDEPLLSSLSSLKQDDSDTFADALSSAHLSITESLVQKHITTEHDIADTRKRSLSTERSTGSSLDDGIGDDLSFDSVTCVPKKKQRKKKKKNENNFEKYSSHSNNENKISKSENEPDVKIKYQSIESVDGSKTDIRNGIAQEAIKKSFSEEKLLDNLTNVTEAINVNIFEEKFTQKLKKDILLESRITVRKALEMYEKIPDTLISRFSNIREQIDNIYRALKISQEEDEIETLINLEVFLHALLKDIDKITSTEDIKIISNFLEPLIFELSHTVENLGLSSLQPTLAILRNINDRICNIPIETKELSLIKSISNGTQNISEKILDLLIDIQSRFSAILDYMECSKFAINGTAASQQILTRSRLAACLVELRECVSHTAHTAMTLKENETLNSLIEFKEPLLDFQVVLASEEYSFWEITVLKEIISAIEKLKNVVETILKNSKNFETILRVKTILQILEDTDKQISKLIEQLLETEAIQKQVLKNLNIDQSLSSVHFALSSVLEKQEKSANSYYLITCIETLRQTIGSSAVTIANFKNPIDNDITREINKLTDPLLNLQKNLLTEKHELKEEQILINLINPINKLKEIIHSIIENDSSIELIVPMFKLLEEIEKDAILIAKEISKKKSQEENARKENTEKKSDLKSVLACQINRSLEPIKQWLSMSEDNTKDEMESTLSLTIEELKRDVTQIAIQTSYSEPPNDESLIEALIDLQEPLIKLKNAISMYHRPEDLLALENLDQPIKHLLQIITDILCEHAEEERLKSIIDIVKQIKNQISLSIKDGFYQQELGQSINTFNVNEEEEVITVSSREIPGTLTEIASTPFETGSIALPTEQLLEDNFKVTIDDVSLQIIKSDKQKREENANKLITILSETLKKLQLEMTSILEDFEESATQTATFHQSKLANFLEELRETISTIYMITINKEIESFEEKVNQTILVLTNLTQPLTNIQELLFKTREHDISELMILNQLTPLLNVIENNVIKQTIDFVDKNKNMEKEFEFLLYVLKDIRTEIPILIQEISSRQKILDCLRNISKPLDNIVERMNDLEKAAEETLETDVANILGKPITALLKDIKSAIQKIDTLNQQKPTIFELQNLLEPLLEFHTCLSIVQSSRRSLVPEACLLDERRSVILQAVENLRKQVCHTIEAIANIEETSLFNKSLMLLNSAILQVQKQIGKTDYSRRSSSTKISLQHRLTSTLNRLANAIIAIERHADRDTYEVVFKCLEALQKQISFTQMQFIQIGNESIDEEAIVEGFLYPTNQLLSTLNILKENTQKVPAILHNLIIQFQELGDSISELNSSLLAHKTELIQEGASVGAPIIETFFAVTDVLNQVKDSIITIQKMIKQKESKIITKVENVTDEIIKISQEEIENIIMITEMPSSAVENVAQSKIEDTSKIMQTPIIETIHDEQTEDNLTDTKKYEKNQEENKKQKSQEENKNIKMITETPSSVVEDVIQSKIENTSKITKTSIIENLEIIHVEQTEDNLTDTKKYEKNQEENKKQKSQEEIKNIKIITEMPSSAVEDVTQSKIENIPEITQTPVIENLETIHVEQTEDNLTDTKKYEKNQEENKKQKSQEEIKNIKIITEMPSSAVEDVIQSKIENISKITQTPVIENLETIHVEQTEDNLTDTKKYEKNQEENKKQKSQEEIKNIKIITEMPSAIEDVTQSKIENIPEITQTPVIENLETIHVEQTEDNLTDTKKYEKNQEENKKQKSQEEIKNIKIITEMPSSAIEDVTQSKIENIPEITQTPVIENLEAMISFEQTEDNLVNTKKYKENQKENEKEKYLTNQMLKFNFAISNLAQPLRELINFVKSATQESLISKSEENKRKIQELTALVQILYDLRATNISIKTALSSLSIILTDSKFSRMKDILTNFEQVIDMVISLTDAGIRPELKENIMMSLQSIIEPLDALENILTFIYQSFDRDKYVDQNGESLSIIAKNLIPCINDTIKSVNAIQILKSVKIADEKETEMLKIKEEANDFEETTARPLEELIEAIMDSQDQIKCDKTSLYESSLPSADPIKTVDNSQPMEIETELNKTFVKGTNDLMTQNTAETSQQELISTLSKQIEEILTEKKEETKSVTELLEEIEEQNLETISQQKVELTQISEQDLVQEIKVETLQAIIFPLQVLHKLFDEIGEMAILESSDKKTIEFSTLIKPLLNLKVELPSEITEEIKQDTVPLEKLSVTCVLQELQKSVASIQEQVQFNIVAKTSSSKTSKMRLIQSIEKPLEDLKMSIACIQSDPTTQQIIQQKAKLSSTEQITILQTLAKSIEQFGERFMSVVNELKIEAESVPPLQIIIQKEQKIDAEILHKIVNPIHILCETLSQIEELKSHKTELLEIQEQKREIVHLNVMNDVINSLKKLEQLLITDIQQITILQENVTKDLSKNQVLLTKANLKPVLEELKNSIVIVQQQTISHKDSLIIKTLNKIFENLKMPLTIIEENIDCFDEVTETEKLSTLLMFAKSIEETVNQLSIIKQNIIQQEMRETSLLKEITIPIEGLQSTILKLEDRMSQTLKTKELVKLVALECMIQPLQELQQSFLFASHQEIAQSLQQLPIKPILDKLNKSVAMIQDQATIVQDLFTETNTEDSAILKDFAKSLGNLRTSTVVLQQLNAIENAGQQIIEIENASALEAFAKSIEEFQKHCSVVVERPKIIEAFVTSTELKQSAKTDMQLLENIIAPLRILREQILTIEETKMQESAEILDVTEIKKPVTVLSSLVDPLQQLEKSFIATVLKEHVIEHDGNLKNESSSMSLEKLALQPILEEVQKSIAIVQEHVVLETDSQIISETDTLLKSIAQPLVELKASIASIQQVSAVAPDSLNELAQQQNISALEMFAETLHNLSECIAMCNHQQIIMEPVVDTFSEDISSLNTWADIIIDEQSFSKVTHPMVIDQGAIESPIEIAILMSEDKISALKTLAKPLTELRECLAVVVEERKIVAPNDTTSSLSEKENFSLLKTIQPLLELKDAATAIIIQEQTAIEHANEHSFAIDDKNEFAFRPLIEPLEELRHSIAIIQDQILIETSMDQPKNDIVLDALAEPLFDLQRAISVLEARVISPDIESMSEDTSNNWITECLAVPLHEIERSIADIRQCTIIKPETIIVEEQIKTSMPNRSIIEELLKLIENIKSAIIHIEDDYIETEVLKTMKKSITNIQENLMLLKNKHNLNITDEEINIDVSMIDSLFNLEKCILFIKKEIIDKPISEPMKIDISVVFNVPLNELKYSIVAVKESPSIYLKDLKKPLELVQDAFESIISIQRNKKLLELSTKVMNTISNINTTIESIKHKLEEQQISVIEICIECEALGMLTKPLQNIKQCLVQIQEKPTTTDLMISTLQNLEKSVTLIRQQSADKPLADQQYTNFGTFSKNLILCLQDLQESIEKAKTLWNKKTILEALIILEKPICKLQSVINIICHQFFKEEIIQTIEKQETAPQKKSAKKEIKKSEIETNEFIEKSDKINKTINKKIKEIKETKLTDNTGSTIINDIKDKENIMDEKEKKSLEIRQNKNQEDEKLFEEKSEQSKDDIIKNKDEKEKEHKKIEKQEVDETEIENKEQIKEEIEQNEQNIKDKKIKKDEKETESLKKYEKAEEIKQIKNQQNKVNVIESIKNEKLKESEKIITKTEEIKNKNNKQQNKKNSEKINKIAEEQKKEQETVQERKESDKSKKIEKDLSVKEEKTEKEYAEKAKDTKKEEMQTEKKKEDEKIKKEKLKDIKENEKIKEVIEQSDRTIKKDEFEKIQKEVSSEEEKIDKIQQKEQEHLEIEKTEITNKEKDKIEVKEIKKQEKDKSLKNNETTQDKKNENVKSKKNEKLEKEKLTQENQIQKEECEKSKNKNTKEIEEKKEESKKNEIAQEKIKIQKQVEAVKMQEQKEKAIIEKVKEKEDKKLKDDVKELEPKKEKSTKIEEFTEKIKEKDKKKEDKNKISKEDIKQKQTTQTEKIKVENQQEETKMDMQQDKKKISQQDKQKDKEIENRKEKQIKKTKEEIIKIDEVQQINEYIKKENDKESNKQKYKKIKADKELEEEEQKQEEILTNKEIQKLQPRNDKDLYLKIDKYQKKQKDDEIFQKQQSISQLKEIEKTKREEKQKQWRSQNDEIWLRTKKEERINKSNELRLDIERKEENNRQKKDNNKRLHKIEHLEEKKTAEQFKRDKTDYIFRTNKERFQKRSDEKRIRRDETARLVWEEEQKLQKRQEEEIFRNKQKRKEQIRESEWSRRRENESDYFLKNMLETRYKPDKLTTMFFDCSRGYTSRFDSGISTLLSTSRSYSCRDSLTSLNKKRINDYWDYKLHGTSMDKYYFDTGSSYRRRKKRENRMIRARSISLLKYEDYSTGDSDATIVPSTRRIRPVRRTKTEITPCIDFDIYEPSPFYASFNQNEDLSWDKPKKPSFCTRLTNRIVGTGMRIRLTCTVLGNPEPRVYWTRDDQKLDILDNRFRTRYENGMAYLELHDALPTDAGIYACIAENAHGISSTESTLRVYSDYKPTHLPPTFVKSIKDTYRYSDQKLILECRVRAHPTPLISWLKDGQILQGERYKQSFLDDDVYRLEIANPNTSDNGRYTCHAVNELHTEEISHMVHVEDWRSVNRYDLKLSDEIESEFIRRPRFSNLLKDYNVPAGGTIALQVEVKGIPAPEVKWLRGNRKEPIAIPKARTFTEHGLHTLIVPEATESERGTYVCRAINAYGQVDTSATVDVITSSAIDGGKPATFVSRPSKKSIDVTVGEDVSISFRVNGTPKPRVIWMKGLTDITDGPRSYKESIDDYVRLTLKRAILSDEGTYCILVKNRYGCDRSFFSIKVKQRARSLTPSSDWNSVTERIAGEEHDDDMSYVRNVPGPISSEPVAIDGGKNWLSLSWGKAERRGPAPVIAYKVDAWLLGSDGGARWVELGITPINAFDAFNLRPGGEYKFRVTPRNRYGWGEPVTMTNSVLVSESTDLPEFTKILPGQLKALEGTSIKLECEIRGDSKMDVRWYRETTEIDSHSDSRFAIHYNGIKCFLTISNIKEDDSGRYVCEASNKIGKVSSFARVLVVNDPRIIEADIKLRTNLNIEPEDKPPQFTMRIRDRRVQMTYPVRLTCQVIGHPVPEITWYKNETKISQDDCHIFWDDDSNFHTLEIIHSNLDDSGCYMVTAKNINGSVSCRCILVVDKGIRAYVAPEFLRGLDAVYTIHSGGELRMSAQLEAYPSVGVVWHRDGIRLRPNRKAIMTLSHDGTVQFSLPNITARDAGVYSCTATNAVGHAETSTRVAVIANAIPDRSSIDKSSNIMSVFPDVPYSKEPLFVTKPLSTEAVEGDTVIILCEVVGDPKPEVIWLRDFLKPDYYKDAPHFRLVGAGPQYRLEIPYAKLDFTGTYSVIARNCHGEAKAIISLQIYAKGQGKEEQKSHGKVMTLPIIKRELRDLRCCDGDAVSLECKVYATPEPPLIRWERGGKVIATMDDFVTEFDGETARLSIQHVYPEDEGEYTCVAYNDLGKAYTSACLVVDVPEGKENLLSQRLTRPIGLLSAGSTPRSTPRSTPIRSLSPAVSHGREFRSPQVLPRGVTSLKRPKICPPKFYAVPHNRLVQEGETVRFQCAVIGHPAPWIRWDKNGSIVTPSSRITIKERDDVRILEIVDVMREDAGLYRVTAENDFGRIEASARLEVINRYESTSRTIRTRSASPRTYPSFDRSLLSTTGRINERLQLECRIRGTPNVTPTWYRNGQPLERSARIKRYFDGTTARIEMSKVKISDAGEYTCVATNVLGSTKSSCQVTILDTRDSSIADKDAPRFLQSLPEESIVMENHCHEFQTGVTGTPPFTITWFKDGRELPDNDYYRYIIYGDGGVALRLSEVRPQDAGEYTCVVRNDFGVASCNNIFAVQDYKDVPKLALQFTKTPLSVTVAKGATACFCARTQCEKTIEIIWMINGKDARENAKCKIERDGNISILRIRDISSRDTGEIRCTASVNGKGPSISCIAKLRLQQSLYDSIDKNFSLISVMTKSEDIQSHKQTKLSLINTDAPEKVTELSLLKHRRRREESPTRIRSSSFPRRTISFIKNVSPLPARKRISNIASVDIRKSFENDLLQSRITKKNLNSNLESLNDQKLNSLNENISIKLLTSTKTEQFRDTNAVSNNKYKELALEEFIKVTIVKNPADVTVFKGNSAVLRVTYQGHPEPTVKWLRVNHELQPDEKIKIISENGTSCLTLNNVTYDHAGKYEVSVENLLSKERRFFSLAVEGPPEPVADKPSVNLSNGQVTIVWRSPPYDGGRTVIGYTVEAKHAGESTWTVIAKSCHSLSHTVSSAETNFVIPGESYHFRIRAENIHGLSVPSMESDPVRIPKQEETMLQEEEKDEFEPSFAARIVEPEEGRLFAERYDVLEELGKGRYGIVKKVIERTTSMNFAAKFVKTIKVKDREQVREEIKIMNSLRHPKLLLLAAAYESPRETILVMEYISGGELFERVVADDFTLTERDSILFMRQICQGVEYMHKNKIVHLDLKPENIMCRTRTSHQIKLIDFGLAQTLKPNTPIRVLFGTPEFIPPEIISYEPIGTESDMWSVGVICYVLLTGLSPFMGDNDAETFANITRADYDLEDEAFDAISNNAKDFISGLLIKRKELRMSATQCLEHPWIAQRTATMSRIILPTEKLKKFIIRRKWQKTGNAIRALGRMAILSAYSRRSPTATAESSPTLEQQFEMQYSDDTVKSIRVTDEDAERVVTSAKKNFVKTEPWTHSTCVTEVNSEIQETLTKKESNLNNLSNQIEEKSPKLRNELNSKIQDVTTRLQILTSKENAKNDKELIEKSFQMDTIPKSQALRRVFRGDSRDSGIGDCGSSQMTSSLQIDELEIESTIVEEVDHETYNRESKQILKKEENQQSSTAGIITSLAQDKKTSLLHDIGIIASNDKVATKSEVTRASCETNPVRKVADENTNTRILSGRNRDRFLPTGNVSRTAKIFERENETSKSDNSQVPQRAYPAALVTGKPHNERIQKAFAFWNK